MDIIGPVNCTKITLNFSVPKLHSVVKQFWMDVLKNPKYRDERRIINGVPCNWDPFVALVDALTTNKELRKYSIDMQCVDVILQLHKDGLTFDQLCMVIDENM